MALKMRGLLCKVGWHFDCQFADHVFCLYCGRKPSKRIRLL